MSDIIGPVAEYLQAMAQNLPAVAKSYWPSPRAHNTPGMGCVVEVPSGRRTQPGQRETRLFANDWDLDFPVGFYVALREAEKPQLELVNAIEQLVVAIDADETLGGLVDSAKVVSWDQPAVLQMEGNSNDQLFQYCTVAVHREVDF